VPIRKSVTPEYIVCLEDGKKLKMLKRHLRTSYGMSPDEYRARWNLPADYPMVAPVYANQRSEFAKKIGLGTKSVRRR
jgi:predicted transcriptional regulator